MSETRGAWDEVADRLSELGLKLKLHLQQAGGPEGPVGTGMKDALNAVSEAVDRTADAIGAAVRDDAVREDTKDVGRALVDALDATFTSLGDRFRARVEREEPGEG